MKRKQERKGNSKGKETVKKRIQQRNGNSKENKNFELGQEEV